MIAYTITVRDHCRPVGSWLRLLLPTAPAGYLHQLLKKGHLAVNGATVRESDLLLTGDRITLKESARTHQLLAAAAPFLDILFEDSWLVAINKPPGLPMHPAAEVGPDNLVDLATAILQQRAMLHDPDHPSTLRLRPINRLDRGTSGAVLLAKSSNAAGMFGRMMMEEGLGKLYLAIVSGRVQGTGEISAPVEGKDAMTVFKSLFAGRDSSLVALWPRTGRMHQLRQHLRHIGHPIIADRRYGGTPLPAYPGHALHAFRTWFRHPDSGQDVDICAPLPEGLLNLVQATAGPSFEQILAELPRLTPP